MTHNNFHAKLETFLQTIPIHMYIFEVERRHIGTSLVLMYKNESLSDLYNKASMHFYCNIKNLFYYSPEGEQVFIPMNPRVELIDYINEYANQKNKLRPLYDGTNCKDIPIVYKIYLEN